MSARKEEYVPAMADAAVKTKTGKDWAGWFSALDKAGARKLDHKSIVELLHEQHDVTPWWSQTVTVEYERARGMRELHQKTDGFSVSATKTVAVSVAALYAATASAGQRKKWFPKGTFEVSSQTPDKYINGAWNETARLNIGFYAKGADKAQIAVQINKLASATEVERERGLWKSALAKLHTQLTAS